MMTFFAREKCNDVLRSLIDRFIAGCAIVFRLILFFRIKMFSHKQAWLRRKYGITDSTPIHPYDDFTRSSIERKFQELGPSAIYAYTSGSTREPKKIVYDQKRLRKTRLVFVDAFFRYLARLSAHRTLFIFSSIEPDQSLTALLLKEQKLPPYLSGLQAPHRLQNHPAIHKAVRTYGETAVRFFLIAVSNPAVLYATNPSTIAIFLHELYENWSDSRRLIADYIRCEGNFPVLRQLHRRIASTQSLKRLENIANASEPLPVGELFPALSAFSCWDGGYVGPFLEQIRKYLPEPQYKHFPMYSMSTETIETVAGSIENPVFLPLAPGVYYEFIEEGKEDLPRNILRPHELVVGTLYSMVVTDDYGLQRYQTDDLFQCAGIVSGIPDLRFVRRRNLSYSFTGEKLTSDQLKLAYRDVEDSFPGLRRHGFLTCFPSRSEFEKLPCYRLLLVKTSSKTFCDGSAVASMVENKLGILNKEFKAKIESRRLGRITFESLPIRDFVRRVSDPNDSTTVGSQFKFLPLYPKLWEAQVSSQDTRMIHQAIPLQEIRVVSWDVDGTLFSFAHLARQLLKRTVDSVKSKGWIKTGRALRQLLQYYKLVEKQRCRPDCVVVLSEFEELAECRIYEREALEFALRRIKPSPIALQLLQYFAKNGVMQIALSDFECDYKLEALGLSQYFQKAYSCREIGFWKPSPVPLLKIQTEFGFRPDEHLHIGDRLDTDGEACARNGCRFLLIDGAFPSSLIHAVVPPQLEPAPAVQP